MIRTSKSGHTLREYQKRGIQYWLDKFAIYYAVDMGLGKTAMTLITIEKLGKPALIIAPIRPMGTTWPEEIAEWTPSLTYTILHGPDKDVRLSLERDIYLINPEGVPWLYKSLAKQFNCGFKPIQEILVIDEGSMWKAFDTNRLKFLKGMLPLFPKYRVLLSGTPAPNSDLDLWSQYFILNEGKSLGSNYYGFRSKHFSKATWSDYEWNQKEGSSELIHQAVSNVTFRLDEKDHLTLPKRVRTHIELELSTKLKKQYKELKKNFMLEIADVEVEAFNSASLSMKLRQFVQGALYTDDKGKYELVHNLKVDALVEFCELNAGNNIMCAIQFKFEREMILKKFPDAKVIAGGTKPEDAIRYMKEWNRGEIPLLLVHPASVGHGTNLQYGGHILVWYGLTWSLEQYLQLNKRLHRSGQKEVVLISHIVIKDSVDDSVAKALNMKDMNQRKLLDYLKGVTDEEMGW